MGRDGRRPSEDRPQVRVVLFGVGDGRAVPVCPRVSEELGYLYRSCRPMHRVTQPRRDGEMETCFEDGLMGGWGRGTLPASIPGRCHPAPPGPPLPGKPRMGQLLRFGTPVASVGHLAPRCVTRSVPKPITAAQPGVARGDPDPHVGLDGISGGANPRHQAPGVSPVVEVTVLGVVPPLGWWPRGGSVHPAGVRAPQGSGRERPGRSVPAAGSGAPRGPGSAAPWEGAPTWVPHLGALPSSWWTRRCRASCPSLGPVSVLPAVPCPSVLLSCPAVSPCPQLLLFPFIPCGPRAVPLPHQGAVRPPPPGCCHPPPAPSKEGAPQKISAPPLQTDDKTPPGVSARTLEGEPRCLPPPPAPASPLGAAQPGWGGPRLQGGLRGGTPEGMG